MICTHKNIKRVLDDDLGEYWDMCQDCREEVVWNETTNSHQLDCERPDVEYWKIELGL